MLVLSIIIDSTYEDEFLHKCCFFEGGKLLKDIKTKGRYTAQNGFPRVERTGKEKLTGRQRKEKCGRRRMERVAQSRMPHKKALEIRGAKVAE